MLSDNIKAIKKQKGLTNKDLAEISGVPLNTLSKILCGMTTNPTINTLMALANALDCKIWEFFEPDESDDVYCSAEERDLITDYRKMVPEAKVILKKSVKDFISLQNMLQYKDSSARAVQMACYTVPFLSETGFGEDHYEMINVNFYDIPAGTNFIIKLGDDSMSELYPRDKMLYIHQCPKLSQGEAGLFAYNGAALCRIYDETDGKITLLSPNENVEPLEIESTEHFHIIGRVIS
ncbi:MAG: helix-turn-helix domain-containing protein [Eubacteriaceae bacterium]|nr:helix-turn-helix domain-containing protein [Eubacteriaceae bacterium]